jgi:hypothetical protein
MPSNARVLITWLDPDDQGDQEQPTPTAQIRAMATLREVVSTRRPAYHGV